MGIAHSSQTGGYLNARSLLRQQQQRPRQSNRDDQHQSPHLLNTRVSDADNNNLASLVSSVSDSMADFVNVDGEAGVAVHRTALLINDIPPAPQLHRLFNEHAPVLEPSSALAVSSSSVFSRRVEEAPIAVELTMEGRYTEEKPDSREYAPVGSPGALPLPGTVVYADGVFNVQRPMREAEKWTLPQIALVTSTTVGLVGMGFCAYYFFSKAPVFSAPA